MILNLTALQEHDLNLLVELVEKMSVTHQSWLTILVIDTLYNEESLDTFDDLEADFIYSSVIKPNIDKLKNLKLTYKDNRINFILLTEVRNEKTRRFNVFLEERLKYKADLLDKVKKI